MSTLTSSRHYCSLVWLYNVTYNSISISYHSAICRECRQKIRSIPHPNYDENYDNGAAASDYEVGGGGADVAGGSNVVRDRDEYGFGGMVMARVMTMMIMLVILVVSVIAVMVTLVVVEAVMLKKAMMMVMV